MKVLRRLANATLILVFLNSAIHERVKLLIFYVFKTKILRRLENTIMRMAFANSVFRKKVMLLIF